MPLFPVLQLIAAGVEVTVPPPSTETLNLKKLAGVAASTNTSNANAPTVLGTAHCHVLAPDIIPCDRVWL